VEGLLQFINFLYMLFEYYIDEIGTLFTKKSPKNSKSWKDFYDSMFGSFSAVCECSGSSIDEFFADEYDMLTNELEPHNRELITRFYNDPKCETIYWHLLEKYYGDNATGETYVYEPPDPKLITKFDNKPKRKKFLGIF
jgi:hypothetical protein